MACSDRPTLHLTNWSSRRLHGPGRRWSIMARPRHWERGDGTCIPLTPLGPPAVLLDLLVKQRQAGTMDPALLARYPNRLGVEKDPRAGVK